MTFAPRVFTVFSYRNCGMDKMQPTINKSIFHRFNILSDTVKQQGLTEQLKYTCSSGAVTIY